MVGHYQHSSTKEKLHDLQEIFELPYQGLLQGVQKGWNMNYMLKRLLKL